MAESVTEPRRVVLGVDASEHSERAFDWYIKNMCDKERGHVMIIHAHEYPPLPAAPFPFGGSYQTYYGQWQRLVEQSYKEVKELLEAFEAKCKLNEVEFKLHTEESNTPGEVICKLAKDEGAQLTVMGSRGMGTLRRTFLGSVSDYCVHHAHSPVIIIPPPNCREDRTHSS